MTRRRDDGRSVDSDESKLFDGAMSGVTPLSGRSERQLPEPPPKPKTPPRKPPATTTPATTRELKAGVADGVDRHTMDRLRRGVFRPEARLDLHGKTLEEACRAVSKFIAASRSKNRRCVLVITGKGAHGEGAIRRELPHWINAADNRAHVICFAQARQKDGGEGAFYVLLKRQRPV